jgi:Domain of unknown function (DUF4926)
VPSCLHLRGGVDVDLYDRVVVTTDRHAADGAPRGSTGYVTEQFPDGGLEVEVSDPATGETLAMFVARPDELERTDE